MWSKMSLQYKMLSTAFRSFAPGASVPTITAGGDQFINLSHAYSCRIYKKMPIVLTKGEGCYVWDTAGNKYLDFVCGYGAVNQGHCHPKIVAEM
jgi:ornithine--oxo-acid transaminase